MWQLETENPRVYVCVCAIINRMQYSKSAFTFLVCICILVTHNEVMHIQGKLKSKKGKNNSFLAALCCSSHGQLHI